MYIPTKAAGRIKRENVPEAPSPAPGISLVHNKRKFPAADMYIGDGRKKGSERKNKKNETRKEKARTSRNLI